MNISRNAFLKALAFAGGGAFGFISSPAPWHLVRDLARWTQNWPWVPVPPAGEPSFEKTVCSMCDGGCGIRVRKLGQRLVRVDGDPHHPINQGALCPLGTASLQMAYGPSRIREPMKRVGPKTNPGWSPVTWEDAIAEVASKVNELRSSEESQSLVCLTGGCENTTNHLFQRFLHAVGSRNFIKMNSQTHARNIVLKLMQGVDGSLAYDIEHSKFILSFGCSLLEGWGTWGRLHRACLRMFDEPDSREIVQVEPNFSLTASRAAQWIPIKPGAEGALALGLAHVLIREDLYDKEFVANHCFGFDEWIDQDGTKHLGFKEHVLSHYSPPAVERITTAPARRIEELAHQFASKHPSVALAGGGRGDQFASIYDLMAVHSLNALVGNINRPGGVFLKQNPPVTPLPPVVMDDEAKRGYAVERIDRAGSEECPFSESLPGNIEAERIRVLLIHDANPYYALPEREIAEELFATVPYIISFASYWDESATRANLILPVSEIFERWDDCFSAPETPHPVYNFAKPVVDPLYNTRSAGDILIQVAGQMGGTVAESFPWNDMKEVFEARTKGLFQSGEGMINTPEAASILQKGHFSDETISPNYSSFSTMWRKLLENNCWFDSYKEQDGTEESLRTPSRKFEFFSQALRSAFRFSDDIKCMPHYQERLPIAEGFDLIIMPEENILVADDGKGTPPFLMKQLSDKELLKDELFVRMNPITAMYHGLHEGDRVLLESPKGKVQVRLHLFEGIREGVALIPLGFGHTAFDKFISNKGVNAHEILEARKDAVSGLATWWATPGRITKV